MGAGGREQKRAAAKKRQDGGRRDNQNKNNGGDKKISFITDKIGKLKCQRLSSAKHSTNPRVKRSRFFSFEANIFCKVIVNDNDKLN